MNIELLMSNSQIQPLVTGSCRCGAIKYSSTHLALELTNCHCVTCRKLSGGPYLTFGAFPVSSLTFDSKPTALKTTEYSDIATRTHCRECGSPISMQYKRQPERIWLTAGTFDEIRGDMGKVEQHIFLREKAPWFEVPEDGILRFKGFPE